MQGRNLPRVSRRGAVTAAVVVPLAAALTPNVAHADIVGDVGVLIAQLEQQLQLVSNAIATVQNLVQTVQHLSNVVQNSKRLLEKAGHGGLTGILEAAQGFISIARGVTGSLSRIDRDARWWQSNIDRLTSASPTDDKYAAALAVRDLDRKRLEDARTMNAQFARIEDSYKAYNASADAVTAGQSTNGVVGQVQLLQRINTQHQRIALHEDEMLTRMASDNATELARMAAERERNRIQVEGALKGLGDTNTAAPANLPFDTQNGWNSDGSSGSAQGFIQ